MTDKEALRQEVEDDPELAGDLQPPAPEKLVALKHLVLMIILSVVLLVFQIATFTQARNIYHQTFNITTPTGQNRTVINTGIMGIWTPFYVMDKSLQGRWSSDSKIAQEQTVGSYSNGALATYSMALIIMVGFVVYYSVKISKSNCGCSQGNPIGRGIPLAALAILLFVLCAISLGIPMSSSFTDALKPTVIFYVSVITLLSNIQATPEGGLSHAAGSVLLWLVMFLSLVKAAFSVARVILASRTTNY